MISLRELIFFIIWGILVNDHIVFHQVKLVFVLFVSISMNKQTFFYCFMKVTADNREEILSPNTNMSRLWHS